jgi:hypothetical protein
MRHTSCHPASGSWLKLFPHLFTSPPVHFLSRFLYKNILPVLISHILCTMLCTIFLFTDCHALHCDSSLTYSFLLLRVSAFVANTIFRNLSTRMQFLHNTSNIYAHFEALRYKTGRSRVRFPMVSLEFFADSASGRTMAPGSNQPLTEMSTRNTSWWAKAAVA